MGFIQQKHQLYLNRFATSCIITGGFSKLLKHFQNNYEWKRLVSFADLRWSVGNLYEKTGWKLESTLCPDYQYIVNNNRVHKFNFRKKYLSKRLNNYNSNISETLNCKNNNVDRIWDCGKLKYVLINEKYNKKGEVDDNSIRKRRMSTM